MQKGDYFGGMQQKIVQSFYFLKNEAVGEAAGSA
jgi:hypothetical protein